MGSERSGVHGLGATGRCIFIPFALSEGEVIASRRSAEGFDFAQPERFI